MTRPWLIVSIGGLSLAAAACGGYDEKNAAYDAGNAAYDESNASYDESNAAYDTGNASDNMSEGNAAYPPPADANVSNNIGQPPPANPETNGY